MNVLKSKWFNKWARKANIADCNLLFAIKNIESSNAVDLGAGLYKLRIAREHQGKSGGFRTIVAYKKDNVALFILGFSKNEKDNISSADLIDLKKQAKHMLRFSKEQIDMLISKGTFIKVKSSNEK